MYRYVETEKFEGKTLRTGGSTRRSLAALKHLPKIGTPQYVKGYVYSGRNGTQHVGVLVRGDKGSIRFGGFSWGYSGTGPNGLNELFQRLGVKVDASTLAASPDWTLGDVGEHWRIELPKITVNRKHRTAA